MRKSEDPPKNLSFCFFGRPFRRVSPEIHTSIHAMVNRFLGFSQPPRIRKSWAMAVLSNGSSYWSRVFRGFPTTEGLDIKNGAPQPQFQVRMFKSCQVLSSIHRFRRVDTARIQCAAGSCGGTLFRGGTLEKGATKNAKLVGPECCSVPWPKAPARRFRFWRGFAGTSYLETQGKDENELEAVVKHDAST